MKPLFPRRGHACSARVQVGYREGNDPRLRSELLDTRRVRCRRENSISAIDRNSIGHDDDDDDDDRSEEGPLQGYGLVTLPSKTSGPPEYR